MEKGEEISFAKEIGFIGQLMESLEEAEKILEKSYQEKDFSKFSETKKFMIYVQKEIMVAMR